MKKLAVTGFITLCVLSLIQLQPLPGAAGAAPNELGRIPILEYHLIQPGTGEWVRTAQEFRNDLESLYAAGYRAVAMNDYIDGKIDIPAGTHPVIFTFDDSSPGQFRYIVRNGKPEIDPDCAVGMFLEFRKRHPDFGMKATFYVLPAAAEPHRLFGQPELPEFKQRKLQELAALGFEIGNHTYWHMKLKKYEAEAVRKQLALAVEAIQNKVPGYKVRTLSLPYGLFPRDPAWAVSGSYGKTAYRNEAIVLVAGPAARSPFRTDWDPLRLPRIQVVGKAMERLIRYYETHPEEIYVSDGKADTVSFPAALKSEFSPRFKGLRVNAY